MGVLQKAASIFGRKLANVSLRERYPEFNIGRATYGGLEIMRFDRTTNFEIGAFCSIAPDVKVFLGGEHRPDFVTTFPFNVLYDGFGHLEGHPASRGDVVIGNDVWIGREAMIMSGVNIGDGAIIGARAVVARDIPPYGIAVGQPARVIRSRFEAQVVKRLLQIQWWEWPEARVRRAIPVLMSSGVESFIEKVEAGEL